MKKVLFMLSLLVATSMAMAEPVRTVVGVVHNPDALIDDVLRLGSTLDFPHITREMAIEQMADMLELDDLAAFDLSKPMSLFVGFDPDDTSDEAFVARMGVSGDGTALLDALNERYGFKDDLGGGVVRFYRMSEDDDEDSDDDELFVRIEDGFIYLGDDARDLGILGKSLAAADQAGLDVMPGGVSFALNLSVLYKIVETQIEAQQAMMEQLRAQFAEEGLDPDEILGAADDGGVDASLKVFSQAISQIRAMVVNLDISRDIDIRVYVRPVPGSIVDKLVAASSKPSAKVTGLRNPSAFLTAYGTMAGWDEMIEPYADFMADLYRELGPPMDKMADTYRNVMMGMKGIYSGGYNLLLLPPTETSLLQGLGLYEIADEVSARKAMDELIALQVDELNATEGMPIKVNVIREDDVAAYEGVAIESLRVSYELDDAMAGEMPEMLAAFLNNFRYYIAYVDNHLAYGLGDIANIHSVIDHVRASEVAPGDHPGFEDITSEIVGYWHLDIGLLAKSAVAIMGPVGIPEIPVALRGLTMKEAGGLTSLLRLKVDEVAAIKELVEAFLPMMGAGMGGGGSFEYDLYDDYEDDEFEFE